MPQVCILTDSSAQFTSHNFAGHELVSVLPMRIQLAQKIYGGGSGLTVDQLPFFAGSSLEPRVLPPGLELIRNTLESLGGSCSDILVMMLSSRLNPAVESALQFINSLHIPSNVHIIDSQSLAAELGLIVQAAAEAAGNNMLVGDIKHLLNDLIPRLYSIFYLPNLSYLYHSGQLDPSQAIVGEMMEIMPLFILENGRLIPTQKARNIRNLIDILVEFLVEFQDLEQICIVYGNHPYPHEIRTLHERIREYYPNTQYTEHKISATVGALLGPSSLGVTALVR